VWHRVGPVDKGASRHSTLRARNGADRPSQVPGLSDAPDKSNLRWLKRERSASRWQNPLPMALAPTHASHALAQAEEVVVTLSSALRMKAKGKKRRASRPCTSDGLKALVVHRYNHTRRVKN